MGILDGAVKGLQQRLIGSGMRPGSADVIAHVAYIKASKLPGGYPSPLLKRSQITNAIPVYLEHASRAVDEDALAPMVHALTSSIFGDVGDFVFLTHYPEYRAIVAGLNFNPEEASQEFEGEAFDFSLFSSELVDSYWIFSDSEWSSNFENTDVSQEKTRQAIADEIKLSMDIVRSAKRYFDTPRDGLGRYSLEISSGMPRHFPEDSYMFVDVINDGSVVATGALVRSGDRMGFFDLNDLRAEDLNSGSPVLFPTSSIVDATVGADPVVLEYIDSTLSFIKSVELTGRAMLEFSTGPDRWMTVSLDTKQILTDYYRARLHVSVSFIKGLDRHLSSLNNR